MGVRAGGSASSRGASSSSGASGSTGGCPFHSSAAAAGAGAADADAVASAAGSSGARDILSLAVEVSGQSGEVDEQMLLSQARRLHVASAWARWLPPAAGCTLAAAECLPPALLLPADEGRMGRPQDLNPSIQPAAAGRLPAMLFLGASPPACLGPCPSLDCQMCLPSPSLQTFFAAGHDTTASLVRQA